MKSITKILILASLFLVVFLAPIVSADSATISDLSASPDPFNSNNDTTLFSYTLGDVTNGDVSLEIYDSDGALVWDIDGGVQSSGTHSIPWDGNYGNLNNYSDGDAVQDGEYTVTLSVSVGSGDTYQFVSEWGGFGSGEGQFKSPYGVAIDSGGYIYVADATNHRIQKFDSDGNFKYEWGSVGTGMGDFTWPHGVAVDSDENVYVADYGNDLIQKFYSDGTFDIQWGGYGSGNGKFNYPEAVAVDSEGNVYVADYYNHRIQKFDSGGDFLAEWGSWGSGDGQFKYPRGVAVDSERNVYVADYYNHRIQKFDSVGNFLAKWGSNGSGDGEFKSPWGITVDSEGNVYVADCYNHRIQKFDSVGNFLVEWGSKGSGDGQFKYPRGVAVDSDGYVYVADTWNDRIQKFAFAAGGGAEVISAEAEVTVDNTPPDISLSVDQDTLWPPNHKMVDVGFISEVLDYYDPYPDVSITVTSDEPTATAPGAGGSTHSPDADITDDGSVFLRAERSGKGDGRVYEITVTATDAAGNTGSSKATVKVNHNKKKEAVDSGQSYDATDIN